ncbi:MAG: hypothetical protein CME60_06190, partial [Halobacteriovoraceae bacterium]|nr:hypothetical protein [Halobacteriovoraceae bacterium]
MKKILASLILIILLILGSVTYLFFNPEIILSPKVLTELNQKYLPALEMEWDKVDIDFTRQSLTTKTLSLSGRDFCAKYEGSIFCFEKLSLMMRLNLLKIWDFDIRELKVKDKKIVILANTDKEPKKAPTDKDKDKDKIDINEFISPIYQILNQNLKYIPKSYQVTLTHTVLKTGDDDLSIHTQIDSKEMILSLKSINSKKNKKIK